mgnify:CR=1 FL=1
MKQINLLEELIVDNFVGVGGYRETNCKKTCLNHLSHYGQVLTAAKTSSQKKVKVGAKWKGKSAWMSS